jgi:hypothetical protein
MPWRVGSQKTHDPENQEEIEELSYIILIALHVLEDAQDAFEFMRTVVGERRHTWRLTAHLPTTQ